MITYDKVWKYNVIAFVVTLLLSISAISIAQLATLTGMQPNEEVFAEYPSDGTAFNEIHRYYGDCGVFGEVASVCYAGGYVGKSKGQVSNKLAEKYWIMAQGQFDVCNLMFNKATYDQYMGEDAKDGVKLRSDVTYACTFALDNIDKKKFNKEYKGKK